MAGRSGAAAGGSRRRNRKFPAVPARTPTSGTIGRVLAAVVLLAACSAADSPERTARAFWDAMSAGDLEAAAREVTDEGRRLLDDGALPESIEKVLLGEVLRNETSAVIRTSMLTRDDDIELHVVFHTHLSLVDGEWKVELVATQQELARATFAAGMRMVGEAIGQGIEEFGQALEQGAAEVRDAIRDAVDDLAGDGEKL